MKNWPEVQKARPVMRTPPISPSHQSGFSGLSRNARTIHQIADEQEQEAEDVRQRGERALGADEADHRRDEEQHPEYRRDPARGPAHDVRAKLWMAAKANMNPTRTPTVVTEAASNWRITSEMTSQAIPLTSESHQ